MSTWTPVTPVTTTWMDAAIVLLDENGYPIVDMEDQIMGEG